MNRLKIIPKRIKDKIKKDKLILAVALYGSYARKEPHRDIDVAIILNKKLSNIEMSRIKINYSSLISSDFDIKIFQQLPIYIRMQIIKEGKISLCKNFDRLYELSFITLKEFDFYKKIYDLYLQNVR